VAICRYFTSGLPNITNKGPSPGIKLKKPKIITAEEGNSISKFVTTPEKIIRPNHHAEIGSAARKATHEPWTALTQSGSWDGNLSNHTSKAPVTTYDN
jgi:hypothetical protein